MLSILIGIILFEIIFYFIAKKDKKVLLACSVSFWLGIAFILLLQYFELL